MQLLYVFSKFGHNVDNLLAHIPLDLYVPSTLQYMYILFLYHYIDVNVSLGMDLYPTILHSKSQKQDIRCSHGFKIFGMK